MGKFYCSYCQTYLTHDSTSVRRSHLHGRVHIGRYTAYYDHVLRQHPEYEQRQRLQINELREGALTQTHNSRPQPRLKDVYKSIPGPKSYYHDGPAATAGGDSSAKQTAFRLPLPPTSAGLPPPPPNVYHERTHASASSASSTFSAVHRQHTARRHQQQQQRQQQQQQQQRW